MFAEKGLTHITSLFISAIALLVSIAVAWFTLFRRGSLKMTHPVLIGFLYDLPHGEPKVFFRAMLYATGKKGHIIEALYLKLGVGESVQIFNFWMYGESKALLIGSGLRVGEEGVSYNHHFLPPKDQTTFEFLSGDYYLEVFAKIVNQDSTLRLCNVKLTVSQDLAVALRDKGNGVIFTWGPEARSYDAHVSGAPIPSLASSAFARTAGLSA